jgi:predicted MFS family arabinose efflux permease
VLILVLPHLWNLWLALVVMFFDAWFDGLRATAGNSLMLEQVPRFRGSIMALSSAARNVGNAMGAGLGGLALLWASYEGLGLTLGILGLVAALAYWHFVQEPDSSQSS